MLCFSYFNYLDISSNRVILIFPLQLFLLIPNFEPDLKKTSPGCAFNLYEKISIGVGLENYESSRNNYKSMTFNSSCASR